MQFLAGYDSDGGDDSSATKPAAALVASVSRPLNSAPVVSLLAHRNATQQQALVVGGGALNSTIDVLQAPIHGPANPFQSHGAVAGVRVSGMGQLSGASLSDYTFKEQFTSFERNGFAIDVSTNQVLGDYNAFVGSLQKRGGGGAASAGAEVQRDRKRSKVEVTEVGDDSLGPWAPLPQTELAVLAKVEDIKAASEADKVSKKKEEEVSKASASSVAAATGSRGSEGGESVLGSNVHILEPTDSEFKGKRGTKVTTMSEARSTFHGESLVDYQGRSWVTPPPGVRADGGDHASFLPKKCIKKFTGHTKGVQGVEFFPATGHLLLSASLDGTCKLWDVCSDRNVKRTFYGHSEAVRSVHFSNDGGKFLSSGFDRLIRNWDVETGQAVGTFSNGAMGYQVRHYPKDDNIFLVAASDNRVYQWDARNGKICQEYNYHLQSCNTITFFDNGNKFASTSDDKKILIWEYDIPVPIKYIAEPDMHSIPSVTLHPSGRFFAGQSMDNKVVVYQCGEKVSLLRKKVFEGHNNSGYACQIGFSPGLGNFIASGDGLGKLFIWDWTSGSLRLKLQAHDNGPTIGVAWSPLRPSMLATCGWDCTVKLWE